MPWTDLTFAFEQVLTSDEMNNLDANFDALAAGDAGAPAIQNAALAMDPEHATDSGTDAYVSATNTTPPADGVKIVRDFQSANTTPTPTLDGKTMTTRDGSALSVGDAFRSHELQYASGTDTYLVLDPRIRLASNSVAGKVELATPAETATGTDTGRVVTPAGGEATYLKRAATSSDPALAFDTWRTPNANRPTFVLLNVAVTTNSTSDGTVRLDVDESGGTTADYSPIIAFVEKTLPSETSNVTTTGFLVPAGGSYRIRNSSDPLSANAINVHREFTL